MDSVFRRACFVFLGTCLIVSGCAPAAKPVQEVTVDPDQIAEATPIDISDDDWPWWRGPGGQNVASVTSVPTSWSDSENVDWKTQVPGRGHGSPTIVGSRIFLCSADEESAKQFVVCFDRERGTELWKTIIHTGGLPGRGQMHPKSTHANCTVACDGRAIYVGFLNSEHITATSLTLDGTIRWQQNLGYFGSKFGYAPSPCLF